MAFFKFRGRGPQGSDGRSASAAAPAESVEAMRRRARHRLLGAGVLVLLGIIGFPLLFDTQPRPVAVDIPIEIPDRNKVAPLTLAVVPVPPAARASVPPASTGRGTQVAKASGAGDVITEAADGSEITTSKPVAEPAPRPAAKPERKPEPKPESRPEPKPKPELRAEVKPEPKPEPKPVAPKPPAASTAADGARARALLDGKGPAPIAAAAGDDTKGRFVVQVGAFADPAKASEARQKLEKAGLKTYTHVTKTAEGERTRVRLGPFGTRAEADRAASRVKGLSMPAAILTL